MSDHGSPPTAPPSPSPGDEQAQAVLQAAFLVGRDRALQERLLRPEEALDALAQLGLPRTDPVRARLLELVELIAPAAGAASSGPDLSDDVHRLLATSYAQTRWSFWISAAMSGVLFAAGIAFLAIAASQALDGERATMLAVAGIGVVALLLLAVTHPRRGIAGSLARAQQVHIVATSYLTGLGLAARREAEALALLNQLTAHSVALLEDRDAKLSEPRLAALREATRARVASSDGG